MKTAAGKSGMLKKRAMWKARQRKSLAEGHDGKNDAKDYIKNITDVTHENNMITSEFH